jgi:hypothetical protein
MPQKKNARVKTLTTHDAAFGILVLLQIQFNFRPTTVKTVQDTQRHLASEIASNSIG